MILVNADGLVGGHAHDAQIDGIQRKLGQDPGQNGGDAEAGVQQAGAETGEHAGQDGDQKGRPGRTAGQNQHDRHGTARREGAVDRQIGEIQQAEGDIDAERHNPPDQALGNAAGHIAQQLKQTQRSKIRRYTHVQNSFTGKS